VLWLEREVVHAVMSPTLEPGARAATERYVDTTLRAMPEHLRLGVAAESIVFGALPRLRHAVGGLDADGMRRWIDRMRSSRVDVVRQYVRLLQSLVLFAEHELTPAEPAT
jgi:hypothetical protein